MGKKHDIDVLRGRVRGNVLTSSDDNYDNVRRVWNGMIDRRPEFIVQCTGAADVISAVNFARENELLVAVRGGGHSFPGFSVCDGGLMIDLLPMKGIRVDPSGKRVRAEPGLTWGEFDAETQTFGLATTGGMISHTGIAGLTLGGGFGWLCRKHGLTIDSLLSVDLVTADGNLLHASAQENDDLFWGLRGGGGNFGVVSSFEYRLHSLSSVIGGLILYPLPQARQVLRGFRDFAASAPDDLVTVVAFLTAPNGQPAVGVFPGYSGEPGKAEQCIQPLRNLGTPIMEQLGPMPYPALQKMFEAVAVPQRRYYMRSNFMDEISDATIDIFAESFAGVPSPLTAIVIVTLGGAVARVAPDATAFSHRDALYTMSISGSWTMPEDDKVNIDWLKDLWARLGPHLAAGVYVNELADEGAARVREAYGEATYSRLVTLKRKYDPGNLFRLNQNIPPTD